MKKNLLLAARLESVRTRLGVTLEELGEVMYASVALCWKLEQGHVRIYGLRLEVLEALERGLQRRPPHEVWGPSKLRLSVGERLLKIFAAAYDDPRGLRPRPGAAGAPSP